MRFNFKITDLQAAIGQVQLARLPKFIDQRRKIASLYNKELNSLTLKLPLEKDSYTKSIYYRYVIRVSSNLEMAIRLLQQRGVISRRPVFKSLNQYLKLRNFPHTNAACKEAISLPIYPSLNKQEIATVIEVVKDIFA